MTVREHTALLWLFSALTAPGIYLLVHAMLYASSLGAVVIAAGPAAVVGTLAVLSWAARREARSERDQAELAAANAREEHFGGG